MTLTVERDGPVTTIVRSRIEARNAMDPASAEALTEALLAFDRDRLAVGRRAVGRGRRVLRRLRSQIRGLAARPEESDGGARFSAQARAPFRAGRWGRRACSFPSR